MLQKSRDPLILDKSAFIVQDIDEEIDEKAYWLAQTPDQRLAAIETMRQIVYNYDPATTRLQRILTIIEPS